MYASHEQFCDISALKDTLGRENTKETTLDYYKTDMRELEGRQMAGGGNIQPSEHTATMEDNAARPEETLTTKEKLAKMREEEDRVHVPQKAMARPDVRERLTELEEKYRMESPEARLARERELYQSRDRDFGYER
jgi:hypothetical protein